MPSILEETPVLRRLRREILRTLADSEAPPRRRSTLSPNAPLMFRRITVAGRQVVLATLTAPVSTLLDDRELAGVLSLTPRQTAVARLLALRQSNPEIAVTLGISVNTVRRHVEAVFRSLNVRRRRDASDVINSRGMDALCPPARS